VDGQSAHQRHPIVARNIPHILVRLLLDDVQTGGERGCLRFPILESLSNKASAKYQNR
jgi:hypothetical protein